MTKEELEKEAEAYALDTYEMCSYQDLPYASDRRAREQAFIAGAEPREKQIADLKAQNKELTLKISSLESDCDAYEYSQRTYQEEIKELKAENEQIKNSDTLCKLIGEQKRKITELEQQIEKMKKYGKLLQDICTVMGNDPYMVSVGLENRVKVLWDSSEEKEGLKMVENIENRLLKIKPQDWAEIGKWEIKEK